MTHFFPSSEAIRRSASANFRILDPLPETALDELTKLAAQLCGAPIARVSIVDASRQWLAGLEASQGSRESALCAHTITGPGLFVVEDATADPRFFNDPAVTGEPAVRFYAGMPLTTAGGNVLGALCVVDHMPRRLTPEQETALRAIARQVMAYLTMRREILELKARPSAIPLEESDPGDRGFINSRKGRRPLREPGPLAKTRTEPRPQPLGSRVGVGATILAALIACVVLVAWICPQHLREHFHGNLLAMKANTAIAILLTSIAISILSRRGRSRLLGWIATLSAGITASVGLLTICEYISGRDLGIDQLLLFDYIGEHSAGRMAFNSAVCFLALGVSAILFSRRRTDGLTLVGQSLCMLALATVNCSLIGYVMHVGVLRSFVITNPMSIHACAAIAALVVGLLMTQGDTGLMRLIYSRGPGGIAFRRLVPMLVVLLPSTQSLLLVGHNAGWYPLQSGAAVGIAINVTAVALAITWVSWSLDRMEMATRRAMRDGLTGLWNRKYLDERVVAESAFAQRHKLPLSCVMLDLDRFKALNDTHGHAAGDEALRAVGLVFRDACRKEDVACRYGGEEFAVLCPGVSAEGAALMAERLRSRIASVKFHGAGEMLSVTASVGVADVGTGVQLLQNADKALYRAKRAGRNRVVLSESMCA